MEKAQQKKTGTGVKVILILLGVVILAAGGFALLSRMLHNARERVYDPHCTGRLGLIGKTCEVYAKQNNGQFPASLRVLIDKGHISEKTLMCPAIAKEDRDYGSPPYCDFRYFGEGLRLSELKNPEKTVLACEIAPLHPDGTMGVLFADGRVTMVKTASIEDLARTRGWIIPANPKD